MFFNYFRINVLVLISYILVLNYFVFPVFGEDWPEWRGKGRLGIWSETEILREFPKSGLKVKWRHRLGSGYSGPAVSNGLVFVADFLPKTGNDGTERLMALDEKTGRHIWTHSWKVNYVGLARSYALGPRATPTVDGDRVYAIGAKGSLICLNSVDGQLVWKKNFVREYGTKVPVWGMVASPLVEGPLLIALVGGEKQAKVMAFNKVTGEEVWRALDSDSEPGYCPPIIISIGGRKQLIIWHPKAVLALEPQTGKVLWQMPFRVDRGLTVATPVFNGLNLLVTSFFNGSLMLELDETFPGAKLVWKGKSNSEIETATLHSLISSPVIVGNYIYGIGSYGHLRCLNAKTGERVWATLEVTGEKARWANAFLVKNESQFFISNDRGELIIAKLSPKGYQEISRTQLISPTSDTGIGRRQAGAVNWSHPAYANRHIFARNDNEIISASLEAN